MLVFRCECEQVLGVEDESSKGGLGECPTCGRIIRVPLGLVNAAGRLRLSGTPSRATPSSALRAIEVAAATPQNGAESTTADTDEAEAQVAQPLPAEAEEAAVTDASPALPETVTA